MTLFSTFIYFNCVLLFLYLGLICGIVFNSFNKSLVFFKVVLISKNNLKIENLKKRVNKAKNKTSIKFKQNFYKFLNIFANVFVSNLLLILFVVLIALSFLVNLKYNFGVLKFWYILIWIVSFCLGNVFVKIVANFFVNFYNYFKIKLKRNLKHER